MARTFDLYFAGARDAALDDWVLESGGCRLFSYFNDKKAIDIWCATHRSSKLFVDSGAFSAWTKGVFIDVDEYISWINERSDFIQLYGQIDVIPGDRVSGHTRKQVEEAAAATWENYLYMRPRMKKPESLLYTFHVGEPYRYLEEALEWRDEKGNSIPYIALGGMVGKNTRTRKAFLDNCFQAIKKSSNPNVKVHAFGMTSFKLLQSYPIASADSTSWIMTGSMGGVMIDAGVVVVSDQQSGLSSHYSHLPKQFQEQFEQVLLEFGYTLADLKDSHLNRILLNGKYMSKRAKELQEVSGPKRVSLF